MFESQAGDFSGTRFGQHPCRVVAESDLWGRSHALRDVAPSLKLGAKKFIELGESLCPWRFKCDGFFGDCFRVPGELRTEKGHRSCRLDGIQ